MISRTPLGQLAYTAPDGTLHVGVVPVRAFPLSAPEHGLSLVGPNGHELLWLDRIDQLPPEVQALVQAELALREFMPTIQCLEAVSSFATPSTWTVVTDRGRTDLVLKTEDDIRRLPDGRLLIHSAQGLTFCIPALQALDGPSRQRLERFL